MAKQSAPRHGRRVTIECLEALETTATSHFLYCPRCHGQYSTCTSDYFWAKPGHVFKCCRVNNWLLEKR